MLINRSGRFNNPLWINGFFAEINQGEILVTILLGLCDGFEMPVSNKNSDFIWIETKNL